MKNIENPFLIKGYTGEELFCDRIDETETLIRNMQNSANTLLISNRRMGKTGLILHVFDQLNKNDVTPCLYVDIFATKNLQEFTNQLAAAMLLTFPEKNSLGRKVLKWIKTLSPVISYDSLTGIPQVSINHINSTQTENSIASMFNFMEQMDIPIVIAFDEFQQILNYPETNTEALLRTYIQHLHNLRFIFSGSNRHMLTNIFENSRRPFFASAHVLKLNEIDATQYSPFIEQLFTKYNKHISADAIDYILNWSLRHTYYTQYTCNRVFATQQKHINIDIVQKVCYEILLDNESIFYQYRQMLTPIQWQILSAMAAEQIVYKPMAKNFLQKYNIGTPSNMQRALDSLTNNEMLLMENTSNGSFYRVYNVFLLQWLKLRTKISYT